MHRNYTKLNSKNHIAENGASFMVPNKFASSFDNFNLFISNPKK